MKQPIFVQKQQFYNYTLTYLLFRYIIVLQKHICCKKHKKERDKK